MICWLFLAIVILLLCMPAVVDSACTLKECLDIRETSNMVKYCGVDQIHFLF